MEAAVAFYRALKVYPTPSDLVNIYDKTVDKVRRRQAPAQPCTYHLLLTRIPPQRVLDVLAEMIAYDKDLRTDELMPKGINLSDMPLPGLD